MFDGIYMSVMIFDTVLALQSDKPIHETVYRLGFWYLRYQKILENAI